MNGIELHLFWISQRTFEQSFYVVFSSIYFLYFTIYCLTCILLFYFYNIWSTLLLHSYFPLFRVGSNFLHFFPLQIFLHRRHSSAVGCAATPPRWGSFTPNSYHGAGRNHPSWGHHRENGSGTIPTSPRDLNWTRNTAKNWAKFYSRWGPNNSP